MEIIRIGAAGIACVLAAIFMKTAKPEYSVYLTMRPDSLFWHLRWESSVICMNP